MTDLPQPPQAGTGDVVRDLACQLAQSIANLGYPVGLGVSPPEDAMMKAAQGVIDVYGPRLAALSAGTVGPERLESRCQHCGGEIQGFMCQSCPATFHENADGYLVFDDAAGTVGGGEAVAWQMRPIGGQDWSWSALDALPDNLSDTHEYRPLYAALSSPRPSVGRAFSVDDLAQEIRRVDGNHDLGAAALAEALMPFLTPAATDGVDAE